MRVPSAPLWQDRSALRLIQGMATCRRSSSRGASRRALHRSRLVPPRSRCVSWKAGISELTIWRGWLSRFPDHLRRGQADSTSGYPVSAALNYLAKIEAPQSWPKAMRPRFSELPYDLQQYLASRDKDQTRVVKQAQQEALLARQKLKQSEKENVEAKDAT